MIEIEKGYYVKKSTRKNKKYDIYIIDDGKYKYLLSFGQLGYKQFKDSTPLKLYSKYDHGNELRRFNYFRRHGKTSNKKSAKYWSNKYLW
jgi:hypothetical protein